MATALRDLPKYLVLNPVSTVRIEMRLEEPACEIDVELDNPAPGRSFVLLIGQTGGPYVQRVRLAGRARIFFDPQAPGSYELLLANPQPEPLVLRLRGRDIDPKTRPTVRGKAPTGRRRSSAVGPSAARRRRTAHRPSKSGSAATTR
jgi:hypothetical protein